jgi:hypothetical protein
LKAGIFHPTELRKRATLGLPAFSVRPADDDDDTWQYHLLELMKALQTASPRRH